MRSLGGGRDAALRRLEHLGGDFDLLITGNYGRPGTGAYPLRGLEVLTTELQSRSSEAQL